MSNQLIRTSFYCFWAVSLVLQAIYTGLMADEAYYWMYSQQLDWGYFDHPPIVALVISATSLILDTELGVRLGMIILHLLTIILIEYLVKPKIFLPFAALVSSVGILHFLGFLALPDTPFLFFFSLFLHTYRRFIKSEKWLIALTLGLAMAGMLLSKYHGFIIILLTLLSQPDLIRNSKAWLSIGVAAIFCLPHLLWQISYDFPSIKYHIVDRSASTYFISYTLEHIASQLFVLGPVAGLFFFFAVAKMQSKSQLEKTLKYLFWGGHLFFFLLSFKGRVEAHWTVFTLVPGLYFGYKWLFENTKYLKLLYRLATISLIFIVAVRVFIMMDLTQHSWKPMAKLNTKFNHTEQINFLLKVTKGHHVAIYDSYQLASLYNFYGEPSAISYTTYHGRRNQYDLWNSKENFSGKDVILLPNYTIEGWDEIEKGSRINYQMRPNFQSYNSWNIALDTSKTQIKDNTLVAEVRITPGFSSEFNATASPHLKVMFYKNGECMTLQTLQVLTANDLNNPIKIQVPLPTNIEIEEVRLALAPGYLLAHHPQVSIDVRK